MGEATNHRPKPMLRIGELTILEHTLSNLPQEITEVVLIVGYRGDVIRNYFGANHAGRELTYVWQYLLNGTAGAIFQAKKLLKEKFLVLNGDDLYHRDDLKRLLNHDACLLVKESETPHLFGVVELDKRGHLKSIVERSDNPPTNLVNAGAYLLNKNFFNYEPVAIANGEFGLPQTLVLMAADHEVRIEKATFWHPCNSPEDIETARELLGIKINE